MKHVEQINTDPMKAAAKVELQNTLQTMVSECATKFKPSNVQPARSSRKSSLFRVMMSKFMSQIEKSFA